MNLYVEVQVGRYDDTPDAAYWFAVRTQVGSDVRLSPRAPLAATSYPEAEDEARQKVQRLMAAMGDTTNIGG